MTKDHIYRECRKLINILETYGNVLVPSIPGEKETSASRRLAWIVNLAREEHGISIDDIQAGIDAL